MIRIDDEFRSFIPAITVDERGRLEQNIVRDGCREPLVLWEDILLDGHNRLEICRVHGIEFQTVQAVGIETRIDATDWIVTNQLGRRNLSPKQMTYLRGQRYNREKRQDGGHGDQKSEGKSCLPILATDNRLADEYSVSERTIKYDGQFAQAIDDLVELTDEQTRLQLTEKESPLTKKDVCQLGKMAKKEPEKAKAQLAQVLGAASQPVEVTIFSHKSKEYYTPLEYIEAAREVMGNIDLDPASCEAAQEWIQADRFYTEADDGLQQEWEGRCWLNPPYSKTKGKSNQAVWSQKLIDEYINSNVSEAILLVKSALGYKWFESFWCNWPVCFARERLSFVKNDGSSDGQSKQGSAFFYFGSNVEQFCKMFSKFGRIIMPDDV